MGRYILLIGLIVAPAMVIQALKIWFGLSLGDKWFDALTYLQGIAIGAIIAYGVFPWRWQKR